MKASPALSSRDVQFAKAFQLGWLLVVLRLEEGRSQPSVEARIRSYANDLGVKLPFVGVDEITQNRSGSKLHGSVEDLRLQLLAVNPAVAPYLAAGCHLIFEASAGNRAQVIALLSTMHLPDHLASPQQNVFPWVNAIHVHFNDIIRESANTEAYDSQSDCAFTDSSS